MSTLETKDTAPADVEAPDVEAPPETWDETRYTLAFTAFVCAVAAVIWIAAVARGAGHGLDTSDEGYYLLSYRWWSTHFRNFTGAQYLYGPVFQALGYSIKGLRLFRLFTQVSVHGVLAFTFMRWLRERRPNAPPTYLWEAAGSLAIVASAGLAYSWLPLSPGYNDVSLLGGMLGAAVVLRAATYVDRGVPVPKWVPLSFGPVIVCSVFAKWTSSAIAVSVAAVALAIVLSPRGLREIARFTGWTVVSVIATVVVIHVFVVRLGTALPPMISVNKALTTQGNSIGPLLELYWKTSRDLGKRIVDRHWLLVLAAVVAVVGRNPLAQRCATLLTIAGFAYAYADLDAHHGTNGGTVNLWEYPIGPIACFLMAIVIGVLVLVSERLWRLKRKSAPLSSLSRDGFRGLAVFGMLVLVPITQALGTGNPIFMMAINGFAAWMAIVIAVLTGLDAAPRAARWLMTAVAAAAILLVVPIATTSVRTFPYRTAGRDLATDRAGAVPALASLRLSPADAQGFSHLHWLLERYVEPKGRAIMVFDEGAGYALALDGQPVGEAWYSNGALVRTAASITSECEGKPPYWGSRLPLLLTRRGVTSSDIAAFKVCGMNFATDYRILAPPSETMGLTVYVPVSEDTKESR